MKDIKKVSPEAESQNHIRAFDLLKLVGSLVIVAHHSDYLHGFLNRGYIAVELFFVISGYLLYQSAQKHPEITAIQHFRRRAKRLFPEYWFAWAVLFLSYLITGKTKYLHWYSPVFELLMLQNIGLPVQLEAMNYPAWYLSVLLYGGTVLYLLIRVLPQKWFNITAVLISTGTYAFMICRSSGIEQWDTAFSFFYVPFWRGLADMFIGTLIFQMPSPRKLVGWIIEIVSGIGILLLLRAKGSYDYLTLGLIFILVWAVCSDHAVISQLSDNWFVKKLGKYQYGFYVNHIAVVLAFRQLNLIWRFGTVITLAIMILCVFVLAWLGMHTVDFCTNKIVSRSK